MLLQSAMRCVGALAIAGSLACAQAPAFRPGEVWTDDKGMAINAHGGGILLHHGTYYWYGEHKIAGPRGNSAMVGVHCYSSKDLYRWTDEGIALPVSSDPKSDIVTGSVIERPKVIYNARTHKFVMWFHLEPKGAGYDGARTAVAVSDKAAGPFTYIRSLRPNAGSWPLNLPKDQRTGPLPAGPIPQGSKEWLEANLTAAIVRRDFAGGQMSRDMNLFVDDDGTAYHITASEENGTLHISQLSPDYLSFTGRWVRAFPGLHNEAPAVFKRDGKYYMITSGCTGWKPNAARSAVADSMLGEWKALGNPSRGTPAENDTTFESQSTYVLPAPGKPGRFIFMADRWRPANPIDGRYIWLPVQWEAGKPVLRWMKQWSLAEID